MNPNETDGGLSVMSVTLLLLVAVAVTSAAVLVPQQLPPPADPPVDPPVTPPTEDEAEVPDTFTVLDVAVEAYEWSVEVLDDGTKIEFTSSALVLLDRPPQEDVAYRLDLFVRNLNETNTVSIEDVVLSHVTPPFALGALTDVAISDTELAPGEEATVTVTIYVDAFFFDEDEDAYKLNAHLRASIRDTTDVLNHLGMNVMFRA